MEVEIIYPHVPRRFFFNRWIRYALNGALGLGALVCGIVNLCVGGRPWSLIVLASAVFVCLNGTQRPLFEYTASLILARALHSACGLLLVIEWTMGGGFASFVLPILLMALLIVLGALFFIGFRRQRVYVMQLTYLVPGSLLFLLGAVLGIYELNWPTIVLGGLSAAYLVIALCCLRRPILGEWGKRFHR